MTELTKKRRRHGREVCEAVAALAAESPDPFVKGELYKAVNSIRKHFGYSEKEKEAEVLQCIRIGASTVNDLVRETDFTLPDIYEITKRLEAAKLIRLQKVNLSPNPELGGRPGVLFFPSDLHS